MKCIVSLFTIVLPVIKCTAGDTFVFQWDSAPVRRPRKAIELLERKTPDFISPDLWPLNSSNLNLDDYKLWGLRNSRSIGRRSRMWMNLWSDWLKSGLVWSRTFDYWHCYQRMKKLSACLCSREGPTFRTLTVGSWTTGQLNKLSAEWLKCKPNVTYACYFNKVIILPCIKCNISLVLISPGSVETDVGWGGNLKSHLMASCVRNISAKNRQNPLILLKVTINNVGVPFYWDTVYTLHVGIPAAETVHLF